MSVDQKHADYIDRQDEWSLMRDAERGATAIAKGGTNYLSMPSGFQAQSDKGVKMYSAYAGRAQFPEWVEPTITGMVGLVHHHEPQIEMPSQMDFLFEKATADDMPLEVFHRTMTREILRTGRYAVLADAGIDGGEPYLSPYLAEHLINWREDRSLFVLDESGPTVDPLNEFVPKDERRFRVLRLAGGKYSQQVYDNNLAGGEIIEPKPIGTARFEAIPLVVVGPRDLAVEPDNPPLIGVSRAALAAYRLDADYRHQLYWTGQETATFIGLDEKLAPEFLGSGVFVILPVGGKMEYVGPKGVGITLHRTAIQDERDRAVFLGAQLIDQKSAVESGEALAIRAASKHASLKTIALASASALEQCLRNIAVFKNLDPEKVTVKADTRFIDTELDTKSATELMALWLGEAISYETMYENFQRGGIASEERDAEEERVLIEKGVSDIPMVAPPAPPPNGSGAQPPDPALAKRAPPPPPKPPARVN